MIRPMTYYAAILSLAIATFGASAQTPSPSAASPTDKHATSKGCSDQADAKGLHGKARKKFRSDSRRGGEVGARPLLRAGENSEPRSARHRLFVSEPGHNHFTMLLEGVEAML
jgi:hypothetical protein